MSFKAVATPLIRKHAGTHAGTHIHKDMLTEPQPCIEGRCVKYNNLHARDALSARACVRTHYIHSGKENDPSSARQANLNLHALRPTPCHTHTHTHARARTHTRAHTRTHTHTHTHAHTHTHTTSSHTRDIPTFPFQARCILLLLLIFYKNINNIKNACTCCGNASYAYGMWAVFIFWPVGRPCTASG